MWVIQRIGRNVFPYLRGFWLYAFCLGVLAAAGCNRGARIDVKDNPAIEALKSYNPSYVLDKQGRVVEIKLEGAGVDNKALDHVKDLTALKSLSLYASSITDEGLGKLVGNRQLEALGLVSTPITDQGIKYLEKIPSLQYVWVSKNNGKLTNKQLDKLKKSLPGITIKQD